MKNLLVAISLLFTTTAAHAESFSINQILDGLSKGTKAKQER